jgi:archaellum component FlaC
MGFFEQLKDNLESTAVLVGKKAKDIVDVTKLDMKIKRLQNQINDLFAELGEIAYDIKIGQIQDSEHIDTICDEISRKKDYIIELRKEVELIKQEHDLYESPIEDREQMPSFIKVQRDSKKSEVNEEGIAVLKFCSGCQIGNSPEAARCIACGQSFN